MATTPHANLTGANLHEPKGVATATANQVYVANGSGSGAWTAIITKVPLVINGVLADVSTNSTIYIPIPVAGTVTNVMTVLGGVIATADNTITVRNSAGNSMGTLTVAYSGSAAGDVDTLAPASNNTVTDDDYITIETDGASTNTIPLYVSILLQRT